MRKSTSGAFPIFLDSSPVAIVALGGGDPRRHRRPPPPPWTFRTAGWAPAGSAPAGWSSGRDGKGPMSAGESAGMIALYFALLLLPVGILKLVHGKKRFPVEKAGIVALFLVASMLVASSAHAKRLVAPEGPAVPPHHRRTGRPHGRHRPDALPGTVQLRPHLERRQEAARHGRHPRTEDRKGRRRRAVHRRPDRGVRHHSRHHAGAGRPVSTTRGTT